MTVPMTERKHLDASTYSITTMVMPNRSKVPIIEATTALDGEKYHFTVAPNTPMPEQHLIAAQSVLQAQPTTSAHLILASARLPIFRAGIDAWVHVIGVLS